MGELIFVVILMRDLMVAYKEGTDGGVKEECEREYGKLVESRSTALKVIVPFVLVVAATSLKHRSFWQITKNMAIMIGGGMTTNELLQWNSLTAKMYLLQKNID